MSLQSFQLQLNSSKVTQTNRRALAAEWEWSTQINKYCSANLLQDIKWINILSTSITERCQDPNLVILFIQNHTEQVKNPNREMLFHVLMTRKNVVINKQTTKDTGMLWHLKIVDTHVLYMFVGFFLLLAFVCWFVCLFVSI